MRVYLHDLRAADLSSSLGSDRVRPEVVLGLAHHGGDGAAVLGAGQASFQDPALHGLGVDPGNPHDLVEVQPVAQECIA
jgi:hypothetical protein